MDLIRQRLVMSVKPNVRLQYTVAAKHPQVTDVGRRVALEERRQIEGISKGNVQFCGLNVRVGEKRKDPR